MSNISRMHEDASPEAYSTVLDFFSAQTEDECKARIYRYTKCGAHLRFTESGIVISSIIEGCDFGTASYPLHYADKFTGADIQARIDAVEKEAHDIWEWANRPCDKSGRSRVNGCTTQANLGVDAPDTSYSFGHFEQGGR